MTRKLILNALAFADKAGVPTQVKDVSDVADVYTKNAFVSLTSAKLHNPGVNVCLITNRALKEEDAALFAEQNIAIHVIPFDAFAIPNTFHWQLAFFKLFALQFAANHLDTDQLILLDSDAYSTKNMDDCWREMEPGSIMLYHLPSTYHELTRKQIIDGYEVLYGRQAAIPNYGGEFMGGNQADVQEFMVCGMKIYNDMLANLNSLSTNIGDEFVTSIAAYGSGKKIIVANAYIHRFMTGRVYSAVTAYHLVAVWHMPVEKSYAMMKLFRYFVKHKRYPPISVVAAWAGLPQNQRTHAVPYFLYRLRQKMAKRFRQSFSN